MLIAEELVLLCLDDETGKPLLGKDRLDPALGGALLAELALAERIGVTPDSDGWLRRRRLRVVDPSPTDDRELDAALARVAAREGKPAKEPVSASSGQRITKGLRERLCERLTSAGVLRREEGTVLGLISTTCWPRVDAGPEEEVRRRLHAALVSGLTPTERTRALVALLWVSGALTKVLVVEDKRAVRERAKAMAEGDWVARAVKQAIDDQAASSTAVAT